MNKKVTKCIIMLLCTIFIWTGNMTTYAAETADPETSDLKPLELYQIDESYGDLDEAAMSISDSSSGTALSGVYRTNWDSYGDDYCYQNLSTTWQELYDEMNLYCTAYMKRPAGPARGLRWRTPASGWHQGLPAPPPDQRS